MAMFNFNPPQQHNLNNTSHINIITTPVPQIPSNTQHPPQQVIIPTVDQGTLDTTRQRLFHLFGAGGQLDGNELHLQLVEIFQDLIEPLQKTLLFQPLSFHTLDKATILSYLPLKIALIVLDSLSVYKHKVILPTLQYLFEVIKVPLFYHEFLFLISNEKIRYNTAQIPLMITTQLDDRLEALEYLHQISNNSNINCWLKREQGNNNNNNNTTTTTKTATITAPEQSEIPIMLNEIDIHRYSSIDKWLKNTCGVVNTPRIEILTFLSNLNITVSTLCLSDLFSNPSTSFIDRGECLNLLINRHNTSNMITPETYSCLVSNFAIQENRFALFRILYTYNPSTLPSNFLLLFLSNIPITQYHFALTEWWFRQEKLSKSEPSWSITKLIALQPTFANTGEEIASIQRTLHIYAPILSRLTCLTNPIDMVSYWLHEVLIPRVVDLFKLVRAVAIEKKQQQQQQQQLQQQQQQQQQQSLSPLTESPSSTQTTATTSGTMNSSISPRPPTITTTTSTTTITTIPTSSLTLSTNPITFTSSPFSTPRSTPIASPISTPTGIPSSRSLSFRNHSSGSGLPSSSSTSSSTSRGQTPTTLLIWLKRFMSTFDATFTGFYTRNPSFRTHHLPSICRIDGKSEASLLTTTTITSSNPFSSSIISPIDNNGNYYIDQDVKIVQSTEIPRESIQKSLSIFDTTLASLLNFLPCRLAFDSAIYNVQFPLRVNLPLQLYITLDDFVIPSLFKQIWQIVYQCQRMEAFLKSPTHLIRHQDEENIAKGNIPSFVTFGTRRNKRRGLGSSRNNSSNLMLKGINNNNNNNTMNSSLNTMSTSSLPSPRNKSGSTLVQNTSTNNIKHSSRFPSPSPPSSPSSPSTQQQQQQPQTPSSTTSTTSTTIFTNTPPIDAESSLGVCLQAYFDQLYQTTLSTRLNHQNPPQNYAPQPAVFTSKILQNYGFLLDSVLIQRLIPLSEMPSHPPGCTCPIPSPEKLQRLLFEYLFPTFPATSALVQGILSNSPMFQCITTFPETLPGSGCVYAVINRTIRYFQYIVVMLMKFHQSAPLSNSSNNSSSNNLPLLGINNNINNSTGINNNSGNELMAGYIGPIITPTTSLLSSTSTSLIGLSPSPSFQLTQIQPASLSDSYTSLNPLPGLSGDLFDSLSSLPFGLDKISPSSLPLGLDNNNNTFQSTIQSIQLPPPSTFLPIDATTSMEITSSSLQSTTTTTTTTTTTNTTAMTTTNIPLTKNPNLFVEGCNGQHIAMHYFSPEQRDIDQIQSKYKSICLYTPVVYNNLIIYTFFLLHRLDLILNHIDPKTASCPIIPYFSPPLQQLQLLLIQFLELFFRPTYSALGLNTVIGDDEEDQWYNNQQNQHGFINVTGGKAIDSISYITAFEQISPAPDYDHIDSESDGDDNHDDYDGLSSDMESSDEQSIGSDNNNKDNNHNTIIKSYPIKPKLIPLNKSNQYCDHLDDYELTRLQRHYRYNYKNRLNPQPQSTLLFHILFTIPQTTYDINFWGLSTIQGGMYGHSHPECFKALALETVLDAVCLDLLTSSSPSSNKKTSQ